MATLFSTRYQLLQRGTTFPSFFFKIGLFLTVQPYQLWLNFDTSRSAGCNFATWSAKPVKKNKPIFTAEQILYLIFNLISILVQLYVVNKTEWNHTSADEWLKRAELVDMKQTNTVFQCSKNPLFDVFCDVSLYEAFNQSFIKVHAQSRLPTLSWLQQCCFTE